MKRKKPAHGITVTDTTPEALANILSKPGIDILVNNMEGEMGVFSMHNDDHGVILIVKTGAEPLGLTLTGGNRQQRTEAARHVVRTLSERMGGKLV